MNIGVDGGALSVSDDRLKVGVYRVIVNLLRRLGKVDTHNTYYIYSFAPIGKDLMQQFGPRMVNKVLLPKKGWFSLRLPLELALHPVDLYLATSQTVPATHTPTIGFLYDMGFLHNPDAYPTSFTALKKQTKTLADVSAHIITISKTVKKDIEDTYKLASEKISVAYPGIDDRFTPKGPVHKNAFPYFLFVGALKPGKNIPTLISAFEKMVNYEKKKHELILVGGDYWLDPNIDDLIRKYSLTDRVKKVHHVSDEKLPEYYRGAVAFVSPSLYEGFCLPAVEAMACGCPVIGSTRGAMKEIIGEGGVVVDPMDVDALVQAMEQMAYNPKERSKYIAHGLRISKKYSWDTFGDIVLHEIHTFVPKT